MSLVPEVFPSPGLLNPLLWAPTEAPPLSPPLQLYHTRWDCLLISVIPTGDEQGLSDHLTQYPPMESLKFRVNGKNEGEIREEWKGGRKKGMRRGGRRKEREVKAKRKGGR